MADDMTTIDDIAARHAASTPGEWEFEHSHLSATVRPVGSYAPVCSAVIPYDDAFESRHKDCQAVRDARFIAHAHQDIPFLLAEVTKLTEGRAEFIETHNAMVSQMSDDITALNREVDQLTAALADAEARGRLATTATPEMIAAYRGALKAHIESIPNAHRVIGRPGRGFRVDEKTKARIRIEAVLRAIAQSPEDGKQP